MADRGKTIASNLFDKRLAVVGRAIQKRKAANRRAATTANYAAAAR